MGIIRTWSELQEDAGAGAASGLVDLGSGIAKGACGIARKYPNYAGIVPYARGFINEVCSRFDEPLPEPDPEVEGGQCVGTQYSVTIEYTLVSGGGVRDRSATVFGSVRGAEQRTRESDGGFEIGVVAGDGTPEDLEVFSVVDVANPNFGGSDFVRITSIVPLGGATDDCGNRPPGFPPDPDLEDGDFDIDIEINTYGDGGDIISTENYSVDFSGADLSTFDFSVNVGGVNVDVDLGGINVGGGEPGGGGKIERFIDDKFDNVGNPPPFNQEDFDEEEIPEEEELEKEFDERIAWVVVDIIQFPVAGKTILQPNPIDNDYFAGYFSWMVKVDDEIVPMSTLPIRKERVAFQAPDGATGFRAYPVNGARLKGKIFREKVEVTPEE